jgi:hypothetical protein
LYAHILLLIDADGCSCYGFSLCLMKTATVGLFSLTAGAHLELRG